MVTAISKTTLFSQSFTNLKDLINANVTDPITNSKSSGRKWIYTDDPDVKSSNFQGYPIIIIRPPGLEDETITLDRTFKDNVFNFEIELQNKYGIINSSNKLVLETIADELIDALRNSTNTSTLDSGGLFNLKINSSPFNSIDKNMQRIQNRLFIIEPNNQLDM